jgi:hypothetical protein
MSAALFCYWGGDGGMLRGGERFFAALKMTGVRGATCGERGVNPTTASRRNVKKTCQWHVFSSDRSGYAARREPRGMGDEILRCAQNDRDEGCDLRGTWGESHHRFAVPIPLTGEAGTGDALRGTRGRAEQSPAPTGLTGVRR